MSDFQKTDEIPQSNEQYKPSIRFLQITHSEDNAPNVWAEARKSDIILVEVVNLSDESRKTEEKTINEASSIKDPDRRKKILGDIFSDSSFLSQIRRGVILEGKEFHYVDVASDNEANKLIAESEQLKQSATSLFSNAVFDLSFINYKSALIAEAQSHHEREYLVAEQIRKLVKDNFERWKGKSICSIQGSYHSKTYRIFKNDNPEIPSSRDFLQNPKFVYNLEWEAENRLLVGDPNKREETFKRAFIATYIIGPSTNPNDKIRKHVAESNKIARNLEADEIDEIFDKLAEIQKNSYNNGANDLFAKSYAFKQVRILGQQIIEKHPLFAENSTQVV